MGWVEPGTATKYKLAVMAPDGTAIAAPIDVTAKWGERDDPFRVHANDDIVWSWFDAAGASSFSFARLASGRTCTP